MLYRYEAYSAVAGKFNLVGGGGKTVGASGGWLMGGGLSALSRKLGLGIDNVVQFEVVLANGTAASVDAWSHPDLFWALRYGNSLLSGVSCSWLYLQIAGNGVTYQKHLVLYTL